MIRTALGTVALLTAAAAAIISAHGIQSTAPDTLGAPTALSRLHVASAHEAAPYRRALFGDRWLDLDHDGCNTREEVMYRDLTDTTRPDGCNVVAGTLADPYTGRTITYAEAHPSAVQIDHVYPLSLAWRHGADGWTDTRRRAFANDPANLLAVDGRANASKGDSGPGRWMPVNRGYACTYARRFTQVAYTYRLTVTPADVTSLRLALGTCP